MTSEVGYLSGGILLLLAVIRLLPHLHPQAHRLHLRHPRLGRQGALAHARAFLTKLVMGIVVLLYATSGPATWS